MIKFFEPEEEVADDVEVDTEEVEKDIVDEDEEE